MMMMMMKKKIIIIVVIREGKAFPSFYPETFDVFEDYG
jgi:hypothetical protein